MSNATFIIGRKGLAAAVLGTVWLYGAPALAAPLNLTQQFPDIQVSDLDINHDAGTGSFTAAATSGDLFSFSADGSSSTEHFDWTYSLDASLDTTGALNSGSLAIQDGSNNTQLTGNLSAFGYLNDPEGNSDVFEFQFDVTGGALDNDFGTLGGIIIVTKNDSNFDGNFGSSFSATSQSSDTFAVVPVPAAVWLFGSGLLGLVTMARRRRHA